MHAGSCIEQVPSAEPFSGDVEICETNFSGAIPDKTSLEYDS